MQQTISAVSNREGRASGLAFSGCASAVRHRCSVAPRNRLVAILLAAAAALVGELAGAQDPESVTYRVTFRGSWTTASTPGGVVGSAHFTTLIGGVHNANVSFWSRDSTASAGIEAMAEAGSTGALRSEVEASPHAFAVIQRGVSFGGTGTATFDLEVPVDHPLITMTSMIGPSPDWFVGVSGHSLQDAQGEWLALSEVDLFPYDAGTEDGEEFSLRNPATVPRGVVTSLKGTGKFSNEPMADLTFVLQTVIDPPGRVTGVTVSPGVGELAVSWNPVSDADGYKVQWRSDVQTFTAARERSVADGAASSDTIGNLTAGGHYFVRVIAVKTNADDGEPSLEAPGVPKAPTPGRVTGVRVVGEVAQLAVYWNPVTDATGYIVQWTSGAQPFSALRQRIVTGGTITQATIGGLTAGTLYSVRVIATRTHADDGAPSEVETGTPTQPNRPPEATDPIPVQLIEAGGSVRVDLADHFRDPEGRPITFAVRNSNAAAATAHLAGGVLTIRGISQGAATLAVTARDDQGLTAEQTFMAMVGRVLFFRTTSASAPEGGTARLAVRFSRPRSSATTFRYTLGTDGDPATRDADAADHGGTGGTVTIPPNSIDATVEIPILDDADIEPAREVFTVELLAPSEPHFALGPATATVTVHEGVCDRTPQVRDGLRGSAVCSAVSDSDLATHQHLSLANSGIQTLQIGDFSGIPDLRTLDLAGNRLQALPARTFDELRPLRSLRLDGNDLAELPLGMLANVRHLVRLRLDGNRLTALPARLFLGLGELSELQLHDNPGAPFTLTLELRRAGYIHAEMEAAALTAHVVQGAPFAMHAGLSATNAELSAASVTVSAGETGAAPIQLTRSGQGTVQVTLTSVPTIPTTVCGDGDHPCFRGLATARGQPLVVFRGPPTPTDTPPAPELLADGDAARFGLSALFTGDDGDTLTYAAGSSDSTVLSAVVEGGDLVLIPNEDGEEGVATVTVTATSSHGLTATLTFEVIVDPRLQSLIRGWRKVLFR